MRSAGCWVSLFALSTMPYYILFFSSQTSIFTNPIAPSKSLPTGEAKVAESKGASNPDPWRSFEQGRPSQKRESRSEAGVARRTHISAPSFTSSGNVGHVQPAPSPSPSGQRRLFWAFVSSPKVSCRSPRAPSKVALHAYV